MYTSDQEIQIENLRQDLCALHEFMPFTAFSRIDRANTGLIDKHALC